MEVKDAFSLYTFMEQLGYLGAIVFSILITLLSGYLISSVLEKIVDKKILKTKIILGVLAIVLGCMLVITFKTVGRNTDIAKANAIKSYMVLQKWKFIGFNRAAREIHLSSSELSISDGSDTKKRASEIKEIINEFPNEFAIASIEDNDTTDKIGIYLVDTISTKAIDGYFDSLLPYIKSKLVNYMKTKPTDTITFSQIKQYIDNRLDDQSIEDLGVRYQSIFTPFNFYPTTDSSNWLYAYRVNRDTVTRK